MDDIESKIHKNQQNLFEIEFEEYKRAGRCSRKALDLGKSLMRPGAAIVDICDKVEEFILDEGFHLSFPCMINPKNLVSHYTPSQDDDYIIQRGDLLQLDLGAQTYSGYITDMARTIEIETDKYTKLITASKKCFYSGFAQIRKNHSNYDVADAIHETANQLGYMPLSDLSGHKIVKDLLHDPTCTVINSKVAKNYTQKYYFKNGDVLASEPFITLSSSSGLCDLITLDPKTYKGCTFQIKNIYWKPPTSDKYLKEFWSWLIKSFSTRPFAPRWAGKYSSNYLSLFRRLEKNSAPLYIYLPLREEDGLPVSQYENTIRVTDDDPIILTKI